MAYILQGLKPELVWRIFEEITRIPRCSKHEEKLQEYLESWARENDLDYKKDDTGNVLLTKKANYGYEKVPALMFQAHQDMVCEKNPESNHDFNNDPLPLEFEEGKVKSNNTSLGADNGLGMALAMAILIDNKLTSHGKLEALFTVDEETGFTGCRNLKPDFFSAKNMINLDSEEVGVIIVSSAGGGGTTYKIKFRPKYVEGKKAIRVRVDGLQGGHSGVDIHLPRYNANKLLAEGLHKLHSELPIRLIHFEGGTRSNVIPRSAYADILVPSNRSERAIEIIDAWYNGIDRSNERGLIVNTNYIEEKPAAPIYETEKMIYLVSEIPFGPKSWSKDYTNLVETSNNNGVIKTINNTFIVQVSSRTSDIKDGYDNQRILSELGVKYKVNTEQQSISSGWKVDPESRLLELVEEVYGRVLGTQPKVTGIHGGLECGIIARLKQGMDIVSIGPTIKNPHSPSEYAEIEGINELYRTLFTVASKMNTM